jgi:ABC-type transport system substrate-binding protein
VNHPDLGKQPVRQAIAMGIDKAKLVDALDGMAAEGTGGIFSPLNAYFTRELAPPYAPDHARELLREAGYACGLEVELLTNNLFPEKEISVVVRDELASIGVRATITELRYNEKAAASLDDPNRLTLCDWHLSVPHGSYLVDSGFTRAALACGCCNYSRWTNDELERLAAKGRNARDEAEEIEIYRAIDRLVVRDHVVWVPLIYSKRVDFVSRRVRRFSQARYPSALIKYFALYSVDAPAGDA